MSIRRKRKTEWQKRTYYQRKEANLCVGCGKLPPIVGLKCQKCYDRVKELERANPNRHQIYHQRYYSKHSKQILQRGIEQRKNLRKEILSLYGGKCVCCGETIFEFLSLDHIHNDGAAHRRTIPRADVYRWVKINGYSPRLQILCMNCNFAKSLTGGICPHERDKIQIRQARTKDTPPNTSIQEVSIECADTASGDKLAISSETMADVFE